MLETRAIVVQVEGKHALVQANQGNGCGQCGGKGCGTGKLSQLFCSKPVIWPGDRVRFCQMGFIEPAAPSKPALHCAAMR